MKSTTYSAVTGRFYPSDVAVSDTLKSFSGGNMTGAFNVQTHLTDNFKVYDVRSV